MELGFVLLVILVLQVATLRWLRFDWFVVALVLASTGLSLFYSSYTALEERNYDASSQLEYVRLLARNGTLPGPRACGVCGHPPLYYALAALCTRGLGATDWGGVGSLALAQRLVPLSLCLSFAFIVLGLLVLRRGLSAVVTFRFMAAVLVFWPLTILNSVRVHNDALASPLMLAALYFTAEWYRADRSGPFYAALVATLLAIFTKASGYAVGATLLVFVGLRFAARPSWARGIRSLVALGVLVSAGLFVSSLRPAVAGAGLCARVFANACGGRYVPPIPDSFGRFLSFHVPAFLSRVEVVPEDPFWNRFVKSSLFGVAPLGEDFAQDGSRWLALGLGALLLAMGAYALVVTPWAKPPAADAGHRVYWLGTLILGAFLLGFRLLLPNEFHEDFRHIFAALVPLCLGYGLSVEKGLRLGRGVGRVGLALGGLFAIASIGLFLRLS